MGQKSEAECLFEAGALYGRRALLRGDSGDPVFVGIKPAAFSIYFGDAPIFHFDRDGRWQRAYVDGLHYLKGLDGSVRTIDRVREGANLVLRRKTLDAPEAGRFDALVRSTALDMLAGVDAGRYTPSGPPTKGRPLSTADLRALLEGVAAWDAAAWSNHGARYVATYGPLPFIPPDCPSPVVLQATLGREGGLDFGGAPSGEFEARDPESFERHARDVAALLGRRVEQCKAVFLGGPDVLRRPVAELSAYLEAIRRTFRVEPKAGPRHPDPSEETLHSLAGIHAFLDRFDGPLPSPADWQGLRDLGLNRVGLGVESGSEAVRALYGKHWGGDALRGLVSDLKAAGVGVGLALLVGAGGVEHEAEHLERTAALVNSLDLGPGDLVALLDARELAGGREPYTPLSDARHDAQRDALKDLLAPVRDVRKAKVVPYSLEKQPPG